MKYLSINVLTQMYLVQIMLTIILIPVFSSWGLGFSLASLVGNIFFAPLFVSIILLAALIFFCELVSLPSDLLAKAFDLLVACWQRYFLSVGSEGWVIPFVDLGLYFNLLILGLLVCLMMVKREWCCLAWKASFFSFLLIGIILLYKGVEDFVVEKNIVLHEKGYSITINSCGSAIFVDDGCFSSTQNPENFLVYTLKPYLNKRFGRVVFSQLILKRPGYRSFKTAYLFCHEFSVNSVAIPFFSYQLKKYAWYWFFKLKRTVKVMGIAWERLLN